MMLRLVYTIQPNTWIIGITNCYLDFGIPTCVLSISLVRDWYDIFEVDDDFEPRHQEFRIWIFNM